MDAGVKIVMEMGVDPGVDHMLAMKSFDDIKDVGGKVSSNLPNLYHLHHFYF